MEYKDAVAQAKKIAMKPTMMVVSFSYPRLILSAKDAAALLEILGRASEARNQYSGIPSITEVSTGAFTVASITSEEIEDYHIGTLLGVTLNEAQDLRKKANANSSQ